MTDDLAIEAGGLMKTYDTTTVLAGLDLAVARGSVFALLGPNGAGKTTTVRVLTTLTAPDGGRATVAGHDVVRQRSQVRRAISLTGQYAALDALQTGVENLRMMARLAGLPPRAARRRAGELLERFDLVAAGRPAGGHPIRAGCAGAWTLRPRSCAVRRFCSSTSRPPALTLAVARRCGISSVS